MPTPRHETDINSQGFDHHGAAVPPESDGRGMHGGHGLMMVLMCVPMLLIAGSLMVTGAWSLGLILALMCLAMMAAMMFMMPGRDHHHH